MRKATNASSAQKRQRDYTVDGSDSAKKIKAIDEKGTAGLDEYLPEDIKSQYHVYEQDGESYDAMLNQTNVGENNNKFYVIQVLESTDGRQFMVYSRWGRVGIKGQDKLQGPFRSKESAIKEFTTKFFAKTKNHWNNRKEFVSHPKFYTWLEMDYGRAKDSKPVQDRPCSTIEDQLKLSKLDPRISKFISLICNTQMMERQMMALGYNAKKLPLDKLSKSTISKGYDVLRRIADAIDRSDKKMPEQLNGNFTRLSLTTLTLEGCVIALLTIPIELRSKMEMVEALGEIEVAASLFKDGIYGKDDPLLSKYQCLQCELTPLEVDSAEFSLIKQYIQNTGRDHRMDIIQIFKAPREGERERFKEFAQIKNRMLLWHGSRLTNWAGILSQGLRIAPPEAPAYAYSFGRSLYFADIFAKSAAYCRSNREATDGVLVLCEVALGEMHERINWDCTTDKLPDGKLSYKVAGRIAPDPLEAQVLEDGVIVPLGKPQELSQPTLGLWYNEYIIYNINQIRIRYVVHVKFCYT